MKKNLLIDALSGLLILLFVYTALSKWLTLESFEGVLQTAPLIRPYAAFVARTIPAAEIAVALLLFFPRYRILGLYASLCLLLLFTVYISLMLSFSPHLPCSCGGVLSQLNWQEHLLFNALFIGITSTAIRATQLTTLSPKQKILRNQAMPKTCRNE